jgi:hypothetical protein
MGGFNLNIKMGQQQIASQPMSAQARKDLLKMDNNQDGKLDMKEVQSAAGMKDGKIEDFSKLQNVTKDLGRYLDKNLTNKILTATVASEPYEFVFDMDAPAPVQKDQPSVKIPGNPELFKSDSVKIENTPAGPPTVLRSETPGAPVRLNLDNGVSVSQWPPTPATFKDPETGKQIQGFKVEFNTGDVMLIPAGQAVSISDPQDKIPGQVVIGGSSRTYQIDANGQTSEDMITMRYASVFCSRQL